MASGGAVTKGFLGSATKKGGNVEVEVFDVECIWIWIYKALESWSHTEGL